MTDLKEADFFSTFPAALRQDEKMYALGKLISEELHITANEAEKNIIYAKTDSLPETLLDILAYDLHIDWYDYNCPKDIKKELIKSGIKVHQKLGTKCAVQTVLQDIYKTSKIEEWFEYNGRPFYFRPVIGIEAGQEEVNIFLKYLKLVKNARSWLDAIVYSGIIDHKDLEKIVLKNILTRVTIPFWGGFVFNGSWLFDGSQVFGKARRYGLGIFVIHGIKIISNQDKNLYIGYKLHIKLSGKCRALFTSHYSARGLDYSAVVTQRHRFKIKSSKEISLPCIHIKSKQYVNTGTEASFTGKVSVPLKSGTEVSLQYHMFVNSRKEKAGNFSVETKSKDYWLFDGSARMDGSRKFNSVYRKETE